MKQLCETFAEIAKSLGYSELHGLIIANLLVENKLSLEELRKRTGYSLSSISASIDLLEILGMVRKERKGKKVYANFNGDILEALKNLMLLKIKKSIVLAKKEFKQYEKKLKNKKSKKAIQILSKEIKRLEKYIDKLAEVPISE